MEKKPLFTKANPTPYNYFVRLADAFLHFRLYLLENPPWLNELVPFQGNTIEKKLLWLVG
jgi:hypothetical protein